MAFFNRMALTPDELLDELAAAYLEALETGQTPPVQEWLTRYPELASELTGFLADQHKVQRWTAPLREPARAPSSSGASTNSTLDYQSGPVLPTQVGQFGDYLLLAEISRGGMGIIYLARQISLNRMVAVKMIIAGSMASEAQVQRFYTEALAAAHLEHPNIVPIYEVGEFDGKHFYSMKVMEGGSLSDRVAQLSREPKRAAALVAKVAHAVHYAHQRGILHRDLKPSNVLLDAADEPHVADFGLSKRLEDGAHSGVVVGTPSYIAPEQAAGQKDLTTATDIYGLGAILYTLLTGRPPFRAESRLETLLQVAEQPPSRPRVLNARVDRDLETICLKCLEKSPHQRYSSAQAVAEDLQRYLAGEPILARPTPFWVRTLKWAKRRPALLALAIVSLAAILGLLLGFLRYQEGRARDAEQALSERRRTDSLRAEVQGLTLQGREALSQTYWSDAKVHLTAARRLLGTEPALADLAAPVRRLLRQTDRRLRQEAARRTAGRKFRRFFELRDQALFQGTLFTGVDLRDNLHNIRATVEHALRSLGLGVTTGRDLVLEGPFTPAERQAVNESCYELLLILAETVARDDPPRVKQALRILDRASRLGQETKAYHLQRARYLELLGERAGASRENGRAAALSPAGALDYFLMGREFHQQGKVVPAIGAFRHALRLQPTHFWARYFLAVSYLRGQPPRADLASDSLTACLGQGRSVVWVYLLRGFAHGQLGLYRAAEEDFRKALDHKPSEDARYAIYVNRGVLLSRQGKDVQAVADLKRAIAVKPKAYQAYINLAKVFQHQQQFAAAAQQLDRAIEAATALRRAGQLERPALALLYQARAVSRSDRGELRAALDDYRRALQARPAAADHAACGRILHRLKRFPEALRAYDAALGADARYAQAHLGRAEALFMLENYQEAVVALDRYLKRPDAAAGPNVLADVYRSRGLTRAKLGRFGDAIADFTLALNHRADSNTYAYRGWAYLVSKAPQLALPDFEMAIRLDRKNGNAYTGRAAARARLNVNLSRYKEVKGK
jgi:tetratricopeptide (TPR) repeat protein